MAKRNRRSDDDSGKKGRRPGAFIEDVPLAEAARSRYLNYALSVITSRALARSARWAQAGSAPHLVCDVA